MHLLLLLACPRSIQLPSLYMTHAVTVKTYPRTARRGAEGNVFRVRALAWAFAAAGLTRPGGGNSTGSERGRPRPAPDQAITPLAGLVVLVGWSGSECLAIQVWG